MKFTVNMYVNGRHHARSMDWPGEYDDKKCREILEYGNRQHLDYRFNPVPAAPPTPAAVSLAKQPHYAAYQPEPITVIEGWKLNYNMGNAIKYISRAGKKDATVEGHTKDLEKAINYIRREINTLRGEPGWE